MKVYNGKSITFDNVIEQTKTETTGTAETLLYTYPIPVYTVPTNTITKIQYLIYTQSSALFYPSGVTGQTMSYYTGIKINNSDTTGRGYFSLLSKAYESGPKEYEFNAIDSTEPKNIYLSAGDEIYLTYRIWFTTSVVTGDYIQIYPSFYMSIIEESEG